MSTTTTTSPHLKTATRASAYFDRRRGDVGRWVTVVRHGSLVTIDPHQSQFEAYRYIGGEGGSKDPYYAPPAGETGVLVTICA
jgi:hypothetical protein